MGVLTNGRLTFLRRGRLGLRIPRPWLKPVELELHSLKKINHQQSMWERFFVGSNNEFLAFDCGNAQLMMAIPAIELPVLFGILDN